MKGNINEIDALACMMTVNVSLSLDKLCPKFPCMTIGLVSSNNRMSFYQFPRLTWRGYLMWLGESVHFPSREKRLLTSTVYPKVLILIVPHDLYLAKFCPVIETYFTPLSLHVTESDYLCKSTPGASKVCDSCSSIGMYLSYLTGLYFKLVKIPSYP